MISKEVTVRFPARTLHHGETDLQQNTKFVDDAPGAEFGNCPFAGIIPHFKMAVATGGQVRFPVGIDEYGEVDVYPEVTADRDLVVENNKPARRESNGGIRFPRCPFVDRSVGRLAVTEQAQVSKKQVEMIRIGCSPESPAHDGFG